MFTPVGMLHKSRGAGARYNGRGTYEGQSPIHEAATAQRLVDNDHARTVSTLPTIETPATDDGDPMARKMASGHGPRQGE